jgi:hypothetical protein
MPWALFFSELPDPFVLMSYIFSASVEVRRRAIVPSFHKRWLNRMITLFNERHGR